MAYIKALGMLEALCIDLAAQILLRVLIVAARLLNDFVLFQVQLQQTLVRAKSIPGNKCVKNGRRDGRTKRQFSRGVGMRKCVSAKAGAGRKGRRGSGEERRRGVYLMITSNEMM